METVALHVVEIATSAVETVPSVIETVTSVVETDTSSAIETLTTSTIETVTTPAIELVVTSAADTVTPSAILLSEPSNNDDDAKKKMLYDNLRDLASTSNGFIKLVNKKLTAPCSSVTPTNIIRPFFTSGNGSYRQTSLVDAGYDDENDSNSSNYSNDYISHFFSEEENDDVIALRSGGDTERPEVKKVEVEEEFIPEIEQLNITVEAEKCNLAGTVMHIMKKKVVIHSIMDGPVLNEGTVLFLDQGQRTLGKIFETFGPVQNPYYVVYFKTEEDVNNLKLQHGQDVYFAPDTEYASVVQPDEIQRNKGSDASWVNNEEPPAEALDYSDDEQEAAAKRGKTTVGSKRSRPTDQGVDSATASFVEQMNRKNAFFIASTKRSAPSFESWLESRHSSNLSQQSYAPITSCSRRGTPIIPRSISEMMTTEEILGLVESEAGFGQLSTDAIEENIGDDEVFQSSSSESAYQLPAAYYIPYPPPAANQNTSSIEQAHEPSGSSLDFNDGPPPYYEVPNRRAMHAAYHQQSQYVPQYSAQPNVDPMYTQNIFSAPSESNYRSVRMRQPPFQQTVTSLPSSTPFRRFQEIRSPAYSQPNYQLQQMAPSSTASTSQFGAPYYVQVPRMSYTASSSSQLYQQSCTEQRRILSPFSPHLISTPPPPHYVPVSGPPYPHPVQPRVSEQLISSSNSGRRVMSTAEGAPYLIQPQRPTFMGTQRAVLAGRPYSEFVRHFVPSGSQYQLSQNPVSYTSPPPTVPLPLLYPPPSAITSTPSSASQNMYQFQGNNSNSSR